MNIETDDLQFDNLVQVWQKDETKHLPSGQKTTDQLLAITKLEADTIFTKLARNFWGEIAFGVILCVVILVVLLVCFDPLSASLMFAFVAVPSVAFYGLLGWHLFGGNCKAVSVRQSIKSTVERLESFERAYFILLIVVCCLAFVCIRLIIGFRDPERPLLAVFDIVRFLTMLGVLALAYVPTKKMLRKLYGQHIKRLKDCLAEIEA